ncbi:MAG: type II secretion system F family protein, partial [Paracoccaceae bacterium]|nr:type II secretion system F family protein [Paracoccaceae bacterium]
MLESLNQILDDLFGPLGPFIAVGVLGMVLIVLTLPTFLRRRADPLDRLKRERMAGAAAGGRDKKRSLRQADAGAKLDRFATFLEPQDEKEYSATRLKLMRAGYRGKGAVRAFHFLQFALAMGGLALGAVYALASAALGSPSMQAMAMFVLGPGLAGYYLPRYWVQRRVDSRREEITNGFPDALDMMLVCVEAGQSLDQSIVRVAREIKTGYPALAEEFELVAGELKAGKDRVTVLRDMAERSGVSDVSSFVTVMIQSATFGTSIADALRVYAAEMRDKRVTRAEERANTLPTKLTLGSMLFTVPPLLVILIGPSIYSI